MMIFSDTVFLVSLFPYYSTYHLFLLFLFLLSRFFFVSFHEPILLLEYGKTSSITHDLESVLSSMTFLTSLLILSESVAAHVLPIEGG
jgi:hypothetical protein